MILNKMTRKQIFILIGISCAIFVLIVCIWASKSNKDDTTAAAEHSECGLQLPDTTNSTLELVHMVFRHGPRTPVDTYPNDPYINMTFAPTGWGHVTNKGKRELYQLGSWLKMRYGEFLQPYYSPERVYTQATASPRALMSLSTVLASMFAPKGTPMEWNKDLNWQPIPIFSEPLKQDSLLLVRTSCPRYFEALEEVFQLPQVQAELAEHKELFANLTKLTGMRITHAEDVNSLYITLLAEREYGLTLPDWTLEYFPQKMQFLAEQSYIYNAYTPEMQKIKGGPFVKRMFNEMLQKRSNTLTPHERKMFIYTGHDWTVGNILMTLKVWERQMPLFSIMTIFELHKDNHGDYYVEIFLRNDERGCLKQLEIPNCGLKCPLDKLIALSEPVLPNEPYDKRCKAKNINFVEPLPRVIDQISVDV